MDKKIIALIVAVFCFIGCGAGNFTRAGDNSRTPAPAVSTDSPKAVGTNNLVFDPVAFDASAFPARSDLPFPASLKKQKKEEATQQYTGIIKNKTRYEVSVPSENSGATLIIPAHSWIEYTIWTRRADVTAYHDGKPFYCLKLAANPREYPFMCSKYDFMAEIDKPEPAGKYKPMKKRKRVKKQTQA